MSAGAGLSEQYTALLTEYAETSEEAPLFAIESLGRKIVEDNIPPEVIGEIHDFAINELIASSELSAERIRVASFSLMQLLMAYGHSFRETQARKDAERARDESEKMYRSVVEQVSDGIAIVQDGKDVYVNPAVAKMWGGKAEDITGGNFLNIIHPDEHERLAEIYKQRMAGVGPIAPYEIRCLCANGDTLWVEMAGSLIQYRGRPADLVSVRNITERKQAEKILQTEQKRTRQVIDTARDAFVCMDMDGVIDDWNPQAEVMFGWNREEALGRVVSETIIPEEFQEAHTKGLAHYLATGEVSILNQNVEITALHRDGHSFPVELSIVPVHMGDVVNFSAFIRDITTRQETKETLEKSRSQLKASLVGTVVAISKAVGARDPYTAGHQQRVSQLSRAIAQEMELDAELVEGLRLGATIHDIGKIYLPAEILSKPTKLVDVEYALIKTHAQVGYDILKDITFPWPVADIAYQHHERLDGNGYPQGLKGDEICLEARIVVVADVTEAMASHRPYRPARGIDAALEEIEAHRGTWFDPAVVDACLKLFAEKKFSFEDAI